MASSQTVLDSGLSLQPFLVTSNGVAGLAFTWIRHTPYAILVLSSVCLLRQGGLQFGLPATAWISVGIRP